MRSMPFHCPIRHTIRKVDAPVGMLRGRHGPLKMRGVSTTCTRYKISVKAVEKATHAQ